MLRDDLIYTAGLFDGDGYVGITVRKPTARQRTINLTYTLSVAIANTNAEIIRWLKKSFEGHIRISHKGEPNHQRLECWSLVSNQALFFLQTIQPFVKIKREQVDLAIEFQQMREHNSGVRRTKDSLETYQWYTDKIRKLKNYETKNS